MYFAKVAYLFISVLSGGTEKTTQEGFLEKVHILQLLL